MTARLQIRFTLSGVLLFFVVHLNNVSPSRRAEGARLHPSHTIFCTLVVSTAVFTETRHQGTEGNQFKKPRHIYWRKADPSFDLKIKRVDTFTQSHAPWMQTKTKTNKKKGAKLESSCRCKSHSTQHLLWTSISLHGVSEAFGKYFGSLLRLKTVSYSSLALNPQSETWPPGFAQKTRSNPLHNLNVILCTLASVFMSFRGIRRQIPF